MIKKTELQYVFSESYDALMTRPDYLFSIDGVPVASMAVTCTQDNQTMNKKRWRYIDEVFQLKSYFGPDFIVINCEFGDHSAYMQSEMTLANTFFDASILVYDYDMGSELLDEAISLVKTRRSDTDSIVSELLTSAAWKSVSADLSEQLLNIISNRSEIAKRHSLIKIWEKEHAVFHENLVDVQAKQFPEHASYLRYCVIGGLIAGKEHMPEIIQAAKEQRPISKSAHEACIRAGFECTERLSGFFVCDEKLRTTINAGLTYEFYKKIENRLLSYAPLQYVIRDINDDSALEIMAEKTLSVLSDGGILEPALFEAFQDDQYSGIPHDRTWLLDFILVCLNVPTNYMNKLYIQTYGRDVIATKFEHYISKTDCGKLLFADTDFLHTFCHNLSELIAQIQSGHELPCKQQLILQYVDKKKKSLGNQPFVNPMHRCVEYFFDMHGIDYHKNSLTCALNGIKGIPPTMSSIHEVYQTTINGKEYWIKAIAGYDGVKDKTREMAARGRLLQYSSPISDKRNAKLVFVYDGKWSKDLLQLLSLAGWSELVSIFEFDSFLSSL